MENDVQMISGRSLLDAWFRQELSSARDRKVARSPKADRDFLLLIHNPRHAITAVQTMTVDRLQRHVAARIAHNDSNVAITSRTASG